MHKVLSYLLYETFPFTAYREWMLFHFTVIVLAPDVPTRL